MRPPTRARSQNPREFGFDSAVAFPPNQQHPRDVTCSILTRSPGYGGRIYDWKSLSRVEQENLSPDYPLWLGICPSWDNEPRRRGSGSVFINSSPAAYQDRLRDICVETVRKYRNPDERLVFINAWNEWAEGAHLEPDQRYGHAWLHATRNALQEAADKTAERRIVLVGHDAHPHGAQFLILSLARSLAREFGFGVDLVLLGPGPLTASYREVATVHDLSGLDPGGAEAISLAERLFAAGSRAAIVNTTASGMFIRTLAKAGLRSVSLVHEMAGMIREMHLEDGAKAIAESAEKVVFASEAVRGSFATIAEPDPAKARIRPQGIYRRNRLIGDVPTARRILREQFGLPEDARIVLGVGYADLRKGVDLFVRVGLTVAAARPDTHFFWVGKFEGDVRESIERLLAESPCGSRVHFVGFSDTPDIYFAGANVFVLTSREDPLPTVSLEAMDAGLPVVCFDGSGGVPEIAAKLGMSVVPQWDTEAFAQAVVSLLDDPSNTRKLGSKGKALVDGEFGFHQYVFDLLDDVGLSLPRVSVVVPNYNYANCLTARLRSIFEQSFPIYELIVLDDASTDNSIEVIEAVRRESDRDIRLVANKTNAGSVFAQWQRGLSLANGDYIWIAEADDVAHPGFLAKVLPAVISANAAFGFSNSYQIDEHDRRIGSSYSDYCGEGSNRFKQDFVLPGRQFVNECLSVKNTILNVSGVVWKRTTLERALAVAGSMVTKHKLVGDWQLYAETALTDDPVAYVAEALNGHRRHSGSVTGALSKRRHLDEIAAMQDYIAGELQLDDVARRRMRDYRRTIAKQFGLVMEDARPADERQRQQGA